MEYRMLGSSGAVVSTLALGTMTFGTETDEVGAHAQLDQYLDAGGNLYIADWYNHRVRKVTAATGVITTLAGNGTPVSTVTVPTRLRRN